MQHQNMLIKILLPFILCLFSLENFSQCTPTFIEADCYSGINMNIREAFAWTHVRHLQQHGLDNKYSYSRYDSRMEILEDANLENKIDSVFLIAKQYLIDELGEEICCKRISIKDEGFSITQGRRDGLLSGKIAFSFYFDEIKCWYGRVEKIEFTFEENQDGLIQIKYPRELPNCKVNDCQYKFNSYTDIIKKGIQDGDLDARYNLSTDRFHNKIEINYSPLPYQYRSLTYDNKNGQVIDDKVSTSRTPSKRPPTISFDQLINSAEGIVDATCIEKVKFEKNNLPYERYLFDVHYVLKGDSISNFITKDAFQGMHSNFRTNIGQRRLLILNQQSKDQYQMNTVRNDYQQWQSATQINITSYPTVYSEIYPHILDITGKKLLAENEVNHTNREIREWLKSIDKSDVINKDGLIIGLAHSQWSKDNSSIFTRVCLASTKDFTYLTYKEFEISYDTTFVGSYGVKNNKISIDPYFSHTSHGGDRIPQTILGELYEISLLDIGPNKFKVILKPKISEKLAQINPTNLNAKIGNQSTRFSKKIRYANASFLKVEFKVKEEIDNDVFEVRLEVDSFKLKDKHFSYHSNREEYYTYQYIFSDKSQLESNKKNLTIASISPTLFSAGDTLTVHGANLDAHLDKIRFPCKIQKNDITFLRYGGIFDHQIIESSFNKLTFIVPEYFLYNDDGLDKMYPTNGSLKIKNVYSKERLELIE